MYARQVSGIVGGSVQYTVVRPWYNRSRQASKQAVSLFLFASSPPGGFLSLFSFTSLLSPLSGRDQPR